MTPNALNVHDMCVKLLPGLWLGGYRYEKGVGGWVGRRKRTVEVASLLAKEGKKEEEGEEVGVIMMEVVPGEEAEEEEEEEEEEGGLVLRVRWKGGGGGGGGGGPMTRAECLYRVVGEHPDKEKVAQMEEAVAFLKVGGWVGG